MFGRFAIRENVSSSLLNCVAHNESPFTFKKNLASLVMTAFLMKEERCDCQRYFMKDELNKKHKLTEANTNVSWSKSEDFLN